MKMNSAQIEQTLNQFDAQAIPDGTSGNAAARAVIR